MLWPDLPDISIWSMFSYFTLPFGHLVREENAYFTEKVLPSATETYKSKGGKVEFRA